VVPWRSYARAVSSVDERSLRNSGLRSTVRFAVVAEREDQ
jgi:hypothetical protein